ncbi:MAG: hypothetical protein FJ319_12040 [SAR202 cluster bacterium]|nr:hypothetical protein [SAR202 cluster bacterium]
MSVLLMASVVAIILVAGQTSLKYGLNRTGGITGGSFTSIETWAKVLFSPFVIVGFALYGAASLLWLRVLTEQELSLAYPFISLSYAASLLIGRVVFHDDLSLLRIVGVGIIVFGAFIVSRS